MGKLARTHTYVLRLTKSPVAAWFGPVHDPDAFPGSLVQVGNKAENYRQIPIIPHDRFINAVSFVTLFALEASKPNRTLTGGLPWRCANTKAAITSSTNGGFRYDTPCHIFSSIPCNERHLVG
jgi:hypothetical protein